MTDEQSSTSRGKLEPGDAARDNSRGSATARAGRIAGIDFGTVRLGIAISDPQRTIASPYENYTRRGAVQDAERLRRLVRDEQVSLFVVGLPLHLDGRESEKSLQAREFGKWLGTTTGVPVVFYDERFTSLEAENALLAAGMTNKRRRQRLDMISAQIMLAAYLESGQTGSSAPEAIDE